MRIHERNLGTLPFTFTLIKPGKSKLQLVKAIKLFTGYGLKEAKDIADDAENSPQIIKGYSKQKDIEQLRLDLICCEGIEYTLSDIQDDRHRKLIELGLGSKEDLVQLLVERDINEIYSLKHDEIITHLKTRYELIPEEEIKKLMNI